VAANPTEALTQQFGNLVPTARLRDGKPRSILFDATKCIDCATGQDCRVSLQHLTPSLIQT